MSAAHGTSNVKIKSSHCGICGSDLHTIESGWRPSTCPCVVGHETVAWSCLNKETFVPCKECSSGGDAKCTHRVWTSNDKYKKDGATLYGGYADYVRVPHEYAFKIPDNIPIDVAAPRCVPVPLCSHR
ncbi:unnamed protein product [Peronospora destructor]|uniref:Alcohol dehydrogenase-like N-terminal domain-containing protein n=1 Tax=Peronospora destructor TaxID=86335 RepID=A0AAV0VE32_9STRA|nr:unnamed protein product [Peronospora destructor]